MKSRQITFRAALATLVVLFALAPGAGAGQSPASGEILASSWLWGKDFLAARAYLSVWSEIDQTIAVFPDRIENQTPIKNLSDAENAAARLAQALDRSLAASGLAPASVPFRTRLVTSADDDFARVAWSDGSLSFLRSDLTIREVIERLGPAERVSQLIIQGERDRDTEPSIAVNPVNPLDIAVVAFSERWTSTATSESVYAVYVNRTATGLGQIFLARSDDHGTTWTSTQVTDDTHHAAYPYEDTGAATIFRHHFTISFDGGMTWTEEILQSMDPFQIPNPGNVFLWGDYEGLTALGNRFYGVFTGESIGRALTQLDPIFFTRSGEPVPTTTAGASSARARR